ncbi:MAG TPA: Vms1/Ankzf1 family peptidyl-tRNA hydrolase, partial [Streptosporangiaceae bacterium]|nr:Vms1/Ankzf1 family peptidyl-tRNA hydrolase [Streptosporangiaceae bacterium]
MTVTFTAADGAAAECHPPFPPVRWAGTGDNGDPAAAAEAIVAHAVAARTIGVLLVRLGGYAVGVFAGSPPRLVSSKTGSRPVHGRSAAGGWSQH